MADDSRELSRIEEQDVIVNAVDRFLAMPLLTQNQARKVIFAGAGIAAVGMIALFRASAAELDRIELEEENQRAQHARVDAEFVAQGHKPLAYPYRHFLDHVMHGHRLCSCGYAEPVEP
jgi:tRNA1(Val) A37 N6-methylase TrmN6